MNSIIQNNLFFIVIFLLLIILLLIGVLVFVIFKLLSQKPVDTMTHSQNEHKALNHELSVSFDKAKFKKTEIITEKFYCKNHTETATAGSCLICEDVFCESCLIEHEGMYFCREHFKIFANYKWKQITDVKTTPNTPEDGLYIWDFKRDIWNNRNIPSFVLTHYKINVDDDFIESYVQLNVREEDEIVLQNEILNYKAKH